MKLLLELAKLNKKDLYLVFEGSDGAEPMVFKTEYMGYTFELAGTQQLLLKMPESQSTPDFLLKFGWHY